MSDAHGSLIKNPKQLIQIVFAAFFVPLIVILLLLVYADSGVKKSAVPTNEQTAVIIKPVANLQFVDAKAPKVFKTGAAIYQNVCSSCHATGAAGAPAFENTAAWSPRIAHGYESLLHSALKGKNAMPARAGTSPDDVSDYEIARAVVYMANAAGAKFAEPKEPAAEPPTAK
jgi:cytochrome c5